MPDKQAYFSKLCFTYVFFPPHAFFKYGHCDLIAFRYQYEEYRETADWLLAHAEQRPKVAIICGSGLGSLADMMLDKTVFPYKDIPNFPVSTGKFLRNRSEQELTFLSIITVIITIIKWLINKAYTVLCSARPCRSAGVWQTARTRVRLHAREIPLLRGPQHTNGEMLLI